MRCAKCPLFTSWNTENDRGECCGIFGDDWSSPFQYEDKDGAIIGCYIERHFIEKRDAEYEQELLNRYEYYIAQEGLTTNDTRPEDFAEMV